MMERVHLVKNIPQALRLVYMSRDGKIVVYVTDKPRNADDMPLFLDVEIENA